MLKRRPPCIGISTVLIPESGDSLAAFRLSTSYVRAIEAHGGIATLIPVTQSEEVLRAHFERLDGILIPGGSDVDPALYGEARSEKCGPASPERDWVEGTLVRWAAGEQKPLLAICRGTQIANVALGGSLFQDIPSQLPDSLVHQHGSQPTERRNLTHALTVEPHSLLAKSLGVTTLEINSIHHQAIKKLGNGLRAIATAPDGVIEAIELPNHPFFCGVQCHPEDLWEKVDERWCGLFLSFVTACNSCLQK